ncbi:hypothetical protein TNCV_655051 [Trichonephila clavipes]|nr:hypothetical protein TNCV_655051 [Trichonephila clavipes]
MKLSCDRHLQIFVVAKRLNGEQEFLEVQENVRNAGSKIRAVGWMIKQLPAIIYSKQLLRIQPYVDEYCHEEAQFAVTILRLLF